MAFIENTKEPAARAGRAKGRPMISPTRIAALTLSVAAVALGTGQILVRAQAPQPPQRAQAKKGNS